MADPSTTSPSRMRCAFAVRPGTLELREVPVPSPGPGEILVAVEAALTCGTDVKTFLRGHPKIPLPAPLGHEFSGVVAAAGAGVDRFREGDAVMVAPTAPCGRCPLCRAGRANLCPDAVGRVLLGAFADYVLVPEHIVRIHVFHRPPDLPADEAAAMEPLACVLHGASRTRLENAETVAIVGDGPIALLFLQVVMGAGSAAVLLAGKHRVRLNVAEQLGARVLDVDNQDLTATVHDWTEGRGADLVIECVGLPATWEQSASLAAIGGEVLLFGGCPAGSVARFDTYRIHYDEVDIRGAFHYRPEDVRAALELLAAGAVRAAPLITHHLPLGRVEEAMRLAIGREAIKVAIHP